MQGPGNLKWPCPVLRIFCQNAISQISSLCFQDFLLLKQNLLRTFKNELISGLKLTSKDFWRSTSKVQTLSKNIYLLFCSLKKPDLSPRTQHIIYPLFCPSAWRARTPTPSCWRRRRRWSSRRPPSSRRRRNSSLRKSASWRQSERELSRNRVLAKIYDFRLGRMKFSSKLLNTFWAVFVRINCNSPQFAKIFTKVRMDKHCFLIFSEFT